MPSETELFATIVGERERLMREQMDLQNELMRVKIELSTLNRLLHHQNLGADGKFGPADAIRRALRGQVHGLSRKDLIDRAAEMVTTEPESARKVLDQTIRNLDGKSIFQPVDGVFKLKEGGTQTATR